MKEEISPEQLIFRNAFNFIEAIEQARKFGYYFGPNALTKEICGALEAEINTLPLEVGDHINQPINPGKPNEVRQQHERAYFAYGDTATPVANGLIRGLTLLVRSMEEFPELREWQPTEIGYQRYRHSDDWIGPHRDRASDKLLSVTLTITGSAPVRIFKPLGQPNDYSHIQQTQEFLTTPGSIMLLRANGFGTGEQVIHQVLPPSSTSRSILNLRMRPTILKQPGQLKHKG